VTANVATVTHVYHAFFAGIQHATDHTPAGQ